MIDKNKLIGLTNRDSGNVGYIIPDFNNQKRTFMPGETKKVSYEEIERLSWTPGGNVLLRDYLIIDDEEVANEILNHIEPEYYYTKDEVRVLLTQGTLEQLQDALQFGPEGVVELIKKEAVELPLNNVAMREEIKKVTGFDVSVAIANNAYQDEEDEEEKTTARRSAPIIVNKETLAPTRKAQPVTNTGSKYKVIG